VQLLPVVTTNNRDTTGISATQIFLPDAGAHKLYIIIKDSTVSVCSLFDASFCLCHDALSEKQKEIVPKAVLCFSCVPYAIINVS
jgi:hypothetical protein